jgi:hypothetical protein
VSTPDDNRPLEDDELAALEYFVDSALAKGVPSLVRRLIREIRARRAADAARAPFDGWLLNLEEPDPAQPG